MNIFDILKKMNEIDDLLEDQTSFEEQIDLLEEGKAKVDGYKYIIDKLESHAEHLAKKEAEIKQAKTTCQNKVKALKEGLLKALEANGFEKFTGNDWIVRRQKSQDALSITRQPLASDLIKHPDIVEVKYEWRKKPFREKLAEASDLQEIAKLEENYHIRFAVNKELKK